MILGYAMIQNVKGVIISEDEYRRLKGESGEDMPAFPEPDSDGLLPGLETNRVLVARTIIEERRKLGWTQTDLAAHSGVRQETISRLESGNHDIGLKTQMKLMDAMEKTEKPKPKSKRK